MIPSVLKGGDAPLRGDPGTPLTPPTPADPIDPVDPPEVLRGLAPRRPDAVACGGLMSVKVVCHCSASASCAWEEKSTDGTDSVLIGCLLSVYSIVNRIVNRVFIGCL